MDRKLASIRVIDAIDPIPGADAIDVATIGGWKVVVKKGEFNPGDMCVYFEIDSWIPKDVAPFLFKGRAYNGVEGERLRTVKLKGVTSQGLLLPLSVLGEIVEIKGKKYINIPDSKSTGIEDDNLQNTEQNN